MQEDIRWQHLKFGLDENIIEQIKNVFASFPEIDEVIIYGSRAKYKKGPSL